MTTHADRDRSERPWWPPSAPGGYLIHTTPARFVGEPFVAERDVDEPVPFVLSDEPQGELVQRFPLDEGDPGTSLLPVAPEGIEISCSMCPATLADTGGGVLWHMEDGSHTYEPSGAPATIPLRGKPDRDAADTVPEGLVARLEALADEWDERADENEYEFPAGARVHRADAQELRDAIKGTP